MNKCKDNKNETIIVCTVAVLWIISVVLMFNAIVCKDMISFSISVCLLLIMVIIYILMITRKEKIERND